MATEKKVPFYKDWKNFWLLIALLPTFAGVAYALVTQKLEYIGTGIVVSLIYSAAKRPDYVKKIWNFIKNKLKK